ncbi:MAG TPA: hypothetical protein VFL83_03810 [Anaeromyxobacter sp.]|nr:hypothetical protein [Anaeromyxobacter sp.]
MPAPRRYLAAVLLTTALAVGAVVAANAIVDPFGTTRLVVREGVNARKPAIHQRVRLAKAYDLRRLAPRAIALGTSRSHVGLRMTHPGWRIAPRHNVSFDGATTHELFAYLVHAQAVRPLAQVVLGLDTWHLADFPSPVRPSFDPALLRDGGALDGARLLAADLRLLASVDTLSASLDTLRGQDVDEPEWLGPDGQRHGELFFRRPGEMFHDVSPRAYFEANDREEIGWRAPPPRTAAAAAPPAAPAPPDETSLEYVRRIVDFCRAHDVDLRIFVTPAHARQLEIASAAGEWDRIEAGKRALVAFLAADAARHPGRAPVPLWDFGAYSSVTTEPLPPPGDRREMRWYWDSSHFKEVVGDWVLDRVLGVAAPDAGPPPADFGVRLEPGNVEEAIAAIRAAREAYRRRNADEVGALHVTVARLLDPGGDARR